MMAMDPQVHALTGAYVCDALEPADREEFEQHLAQCPACAQEVAELRETTAVLGAAAYENPPQRLHDTVFARIENLRQLPPNVARHQAADQADQADHADRQPGADNVIPIQRGRERRRRFSRAAVAGWAAAAVLAGVVGGLAVHTASQDQQISQADARAAQLSTLLSAPDVRTAVGKVTGGGFVTVIDSRQLDRAAITLTGLAAPPTGKAYQLWMIAPGVVRSGGVVPAGANNAAAPILADGLGKTVSVAITVEPAHGSAQPTTSPILLMPMPA
jgi:anti-sigma factor RsiW